jgi:transposase-like protein
MNEDNLKKLQALRSLPRTVNVDQNLRWPEGIICPRCHSKNIVHKKPPPESKDQRGYYECLQCQRSGGSSFFDDLTGLPIDVVETHLINYLNNWILCWYLIGFCSLTKIAQVLGLSLAQVMEIAKLGTQITEVSKEAKMEMEYGFFTKSYKDKIRLGKEKKQAETLQAELETRSESKNPFKPGPKSQK